MLTRSKILIGTALLAVVGTSLQAQAASKTNEETGLIGVKLYSTGLTIVEKFGSPDAIESVNAGSVTTGGGGGPASSGPGGIPGVPGGPGGPGPEPGRRAPGGSGPGAPQQSAETNPLDFGNGLLQAGGKFSPMAKRGGGGGGGAPSPASASPGGGPAGGPGLGGPSKGSSGGAGGSGTSVEFTRWIYYRNGCQYGFVFDKYNKVIQIEAIGLHNRSVETKRGITFGATIAQVIKKYTKDSDGSYDPPAYELNGDTLVLKFLTHNHVAFRFNRLATGRPQVVTGIAIAGGKY